MIQVHHLGGIRDPLTEVTIPIAGPRDETTTMTGGEVIVTETVMGEKSGGNDRRNPTGEAITRGYYQFVYRVADLPPL